MQLKEVRRNNKGISKRGIDVENDKNVEKVENIEKVEYKIIDQNSCNDEEIFLFRSSTVSIRPYFMTMMWKHTTKPSTQTAIANHSAVGFGCF